MYCFSHRLIASSIELIYCFTLMITMSFPKHRSSLVICLKLIAVIMPSIFYRQNRAQFFVFVPIHMTEHDFRVNFFKPARIMFP